MRTIVGRLWLLIALTLCVPPTGEIGVGSAPIIPPQISPVATSLTYLPLILRPCDTYTAALFLNTPTTSLQAGELVTVTATLLNQGCVALGQPYYRLALHPQSPLLPPNPDPQTHSLAVAPQSSDTATFTFTTTITGQAILTGTVDFEVHFETGPPLRRRSTSAPLTITVTL